MVSKWISRVSLLLLFSAESFYWVCYMVLYFKMYQDISALTNVQLFALVVIFFLNEPSAFSLIFKFKALCCLFTRLFIVWTWLPCKMFPPLCYHTMGSRQRSCPNAIIWRNDVNKWIWRAVELELTQMASESWVSLSRVCGHSFNEGKITPRTQKV